MACDTAPIRWQGVSRARVPLTNGEHLLLGVGVGKAGGCAPTLPSVAFYSSAFCARITHIADVPSHAAKGVGRCPDTTH